MSQDQKLASTDVADIKLLDLDQVITHDAHQCEDDELKTTMRVRTILKKKMRRVTIVQIIVDTKL
jgi:hypothetical protein